MSADPFLPGLFLRAGAGRAWENGLCVMEAVDWLSGAREAGRPPTDHPDCACPVLARFAINLNDRLIDKNRQQLKGLILPLVGTRSDEHRLQRAEYLVMRVGTEIVPKWFERAGLHAEAQRIASAKNVQKLGAAAQCGRETARAAHAAAAAAGAQGGREKVLAAYAAAAAAAAYAIAAGAADVAAAAQCGREKVLAARAALAADSAAAAGDAVAVVAADADAFRQEMLLQCIPILRGAIDLGPSVEPRPEGSDRAGAAPKGCATRPAIREQQITQRRWRGPLWASLAIRFSERLGRL